ncbi:RNA pseudouridine synthase 1 [Henckelia pumila]|uniref:RNA pseudouridine synthase 1 n=1 Tax=Henckelia pumila TaxID=405737 RepID=UPI003C6E38BA
MTRMPLAVSLFSMAAETLTPANGYPVPLSPPLPAISKTLELNRAFTASSKSSLFSLSKTDLLFEDEWLVAVNKPQGIYCESVLSAVHKLLNDNGEQQLKLHLANRLDRDTSGVTLITKSHQVAAKLVQAFTQHTVNKSYIAFCVGTVPKWDNIVIKSGHGRSKHGAWRVYATSDVGRSLPGGSIVKNMETSFQVISVNGVSSASEKREEENAIVVEEKSSHATCECDLEKAEVLVRACPSSGRTHQIRLHCQYLGIPIRGDVKYEGVHEWKGARYEGHQLHAESLAFEHPVKRGPLLIRAPLPLWASQELGL